MENFTFYHEFSDKARRVSAGNVIAAIITDKPVRSGSHLCYDAIVALLAQPNSPVCGSSVALEYLDTRCKRVSEAEARTIHPNLFERLDRDARDAAANAAYDKHPARAFA